MKSIQSDFHISNIHRPWNNFLSSKSHICQCKSTWPNNHSGHQCTCSCRMLGPCKHILYSSCHWYHHNSHLEKCNESKMKLVGTIWYQPLLKRECYLHHNHIQHCCFHHRNSCRLSIGGSRKILVLGLVQEWRFHLIPKFNGIFRANLTYS